jgi:hypothetical protein
MGNTHLRSDIRERGAARTASFSTFQGTTMTVTTGNLTTGNIETLNATDANVAASLKVGNTASKVVIDQAHGVRLVGIDAWEDLRFSPENVRINAANSKPDIITFVGQTRCLGFDNTASEWVTFSAQLPHRWLQGTEVETHVHWAPTSDADGNVRWVLEYTWANKDSIFPSIATTGGTGVAASQNRHTYTDLGELTGTGKTVSSVIMCRLLRDVSASGDTYAADAALLEVDFHYRVDGFGSEGETSKA